MIGQIPILRLLAMLSPQEASIPKMRVGRWGDGGYVINDDLDGLDGVVSLGISTEASFDEYFANRGIRVCQYDHTVDAPPVPHDQFAFRKIAWGNRNDSETRTLAGMLQENGLADSNNLVLKFDTEGAEWSSLSGVCSSDDMKKFRIIVCELHGLCNLQDDHFYYRAHKTLSLLTYSHVPTHLHANNWGKFEIVAGIPIADVIEVSFLRKDRADFRLHPHPVPSALDCANNAGKPDIVLSPFGAGSS